MIFPQHTCISLIIWHIHNLLLYNCDMNKVSLHMYMIINFLPVNPEFINHYTAIIVYELINKILYHILNFYTLGFILFKVSASFSKAVHGLEVLRHPNTTGSLLHHTLYLACHIVITDHMVQFLQSLLCVCWKNFLCKTSFQYIFLQSNKGTRIYYK